MTTLISEKAIFEVGPHQRYPFPPKEEAEGGPKGELFRVRRCNNRCFFCFINGLPKGLRPGLYIKDDDYRLSFLYGNFVTLTNWQERDWHWLEQQRPSPLYVSVHTTDLELRRRMLGNPKAPDIVEQLRRLASLRIRVQAQIVLCPGVNDGDVLTKTISDLAALYPCVQSIGIVPVGVTEYWSKNGRANGQGKPISCAAPMAKSIIERARSWQREYRQRLGVSLVYLADEFYLLANRSVPSARYYDGFPQYQNGIGLTRDLLDDWARVKRHLKNRNVNGIKHPLSVIMACGQLIAPTLATIVTELNQLDNLSVQLVPVINSFFGKTVTVSGLLTGTDIINALKRQGRSDLVVLPRTMLDTYSERTLDEHRPRDFEEVLATKVAFASSASELIRLIGLRERI